VGLSSEWRVVEIKPVCISLVGNIVTRVLIGASYSFNYHITRHLRSPAQIPSAKGRPITANLLMETCTIMARHCSTCAEFRVHASMRATCRSNTERIGFILIVYSDMIKVKRRRRHIY